MLIFRGLPCTPSTQSFATTIGNFDGVHVGHQAMLGELASQAKTKNLRSCVVTFSPHPRAYFDPKNAPKSVSTLRDKVAAIRACGIDRLVILPFDRKLASTSPQAFVQDILVHALQTKFLLIGDDFRFGSKRAGDFSMLQSLLPHYGCAVQAMPSVEVHAQRVSSSAVRMALSNGRMEEVELLLDRPYVISGHVIHGAKLGRDLGFPTLNIAFKAGTPAAQGIFVVRVFGLSENPLESIQGVANLGTRPALDASDVNGGRVLLETYCLNWPVGLGSEGGYGKIIRVELLHKLHDELAYDGLESLKLGIQNDIVLAQDYFSKL